MLLDLIASPKQALFRSTQLMSLSRIEESTYRDFIARHFRNNNKTIKSDQINDGLNWTMGHTYYVQYYFHRLFGLSSSRVDRKLIESVKKMIFQENEITFMNYRNLMTTMQWKLLTAIAKEAAVSEFSGKAFIQERRLGAHSSVRRALDFLLDAQMIYKEYESRDSKPIYKVYDVFLSRWLET